jgi:hypothetical protein
MQEYAKFCSSHYVPLHLQPHWLDTVCAEGTWGVALARNGEGITGAWPWYRCRRWGVVPVIQNAPLTSYAGPWLQYPVGPPLRPVSRYTFDKKTLTELAHQLPHQRAWLRQTCRPELTNWQPLHWLGYRQSTRYTYLLDTRCAVDLIFEGFKNTLRTHLRHAHEQVAATPTDDIETVYRIHNQSLVRRGAAVRHTFFHFKKLHDALRERGQCRAWLATDRRDTTPHAALYLVHDERQAGVLLTGTDPARKQSSAVYVLYEAAIRYCHERRLVLDFEGSMIESVEHTFRAFGGIQTPYFLVSK